jgi:hypothetical protein
VFIEVEHVTSSTIVLLSIYSQEKETDDMGNLQASEMAQVVRDGLQLDIALEWHLFTNHFPPLPRGILELAKQAIKLWNEGDHDATIDVSSVGEHRRYGTDVPVGECLTNWHLWAYVDNDEEFS